MAKAVCIHDLQQPGHGATCNVGALAKQLSQDLADAVDLPVCIEDALDMRPKLRIPFGKVRQSRRVPLSLRNVEEFFSCMESRSAVKP